MEEKWAYKKHNLNIFSSKFRIIPSNHEERCCATVNFTPLGFFQEIETLNATHPPLPIDRWILSRRLLKVLSRTSYVLCMCVCEYLKLAVWRQTPWNIAAFQESGCRENPEVRARLWLLPLHLTLSAPPPHKATIFPLFFPALIFLEPAAEYWAQFVCVCGE